MSVSSNKFSLESEYSSLYELKKESLKTHFEFLDSMRSRHLFWATRIQNSELIQIHVEIIRSIEQTMQRYEWLLETYQNHE